MRSDLLLGRPAGALLLDADGCLFPSEAPAYVASAEVTNRMLAELGVQRRYTGPELRANHTGRNFRATAPLLCAENGVELAPGDLERWVGEEKDAVTRHLSTDLVPDPEVLAALGALAAAYPVAVVSSSATTRVRACLRATGLDGIVPRDRIYSAEDSLPLPVSKPDPAIYSWAGVRLGVAGAEALAVEDSVVGVRSATAAGFPVLGLLHFVPPEEAEVQRAALRAAGAVAVLDTWSDVAFLLLGDDVATGPPTYASSVGEGR